VQQGSVLHGWPAGEKTKPTSAPKPPPTLWAPAAKALTRRLALRTDGLLRNDPLNLHKTSHITKNRQAAEAASSCDSGADLRSRAISAVVANSVATAPTRAKNPYPTRSA
jgi:hypothetical protein